MSRFLPLTLWGLMNETYEQQGITAEPLALLVWNRVLIWDWKEVRSCPLFGASLGVRVTSHGYLGAAMFLTLLGI